MTQQSVSLLSAPNEKPPMSKARNLSHTPLINVNKDSSSRNMLGRRGNSVVQNQNSFFGMLSPSDSSQPSTKQQAVNFSSAKKSTMTQKRNSDTLPKLAMARFAKKNSSMVSTQVDSLED